MEIKIIYEDEGLLVIDKPSGVVVNRSESARGETVQDWAEEKLNIKNKILKIENDEQRITNNEELEFYGRGGVVHRLDKETSGILLIAKNPQSFLNLKNQFKERLIEKEYLALAHGEVKPGEGVINVPVGRLPYNRTKFGVVAGGRDALTNYEVINYYKFKNGKLTYLRLNPKTGRTHQIRVHLKHLNHPIFADPLYAGRKVGRDDRKYLNRLFLHAAKIKFVHPKSLKPISFESPLPQDISNFLSKLDLSS